MLSDEAARAVPRPSLPPALWAVSGVWCGITAAERGAWVGGASVAPWVIACLGCAVVLMLRRVHIGALVALGLCVGLAAGSLYWEWLSIRTDQLGEHTAGRYTAVAIADPTMGSFGERSAVRLEGLGGERVEVSWPRGGDVPEAGELVEFFGTLKTGGDDEWARRRHQAGIAATAKARVVHVRGWSRTLRGAVGPWRLRGIAALRAVPGPGGDLAAGVILGDRRRLSGTQADTDFRTTGLTHLVAVSGSHLVVVAALVAWAMRSMHLSRRWTVACTVAVIGLYVVATGVQASAVRAWGMAAVASTAGLSGRRSDASAGLAFAAGVALVAYPPVAFDLGFRLSVAAVAGLVLFSRLAESWTAAALPGLARRLAGPVALTLTAQAATVPLTVGTFGVVSVISPVANLFVAPLVSLVLVVGLGGILITGVWPWAAGFLLHVACAAGGAAASIAGWLSRVPGASVPVSIPSAAAVIITLGAGVWLWAVWPKARTYLARIVAACVCMAVVALVAGPPPPRGASITVADVGQGDAIIVRDGGRAVLVDAGPDVGTLSDALRRNGVRRLERVVITHLHDDHVAGAKALAGVIPVGEVIVARGAEKELPDALRRLKAPVRGVIAGDTLRCGRIGMTVLSPPSPPVDAADNTASLVLLVSTPGATVLLTGDAESSVLEPLCRDGVLSDVDALKVGHHGSADAVSSAVLEVARPELALISVGEGNRYGHPDDDTVSLLLTSGVSVRRTDEEGDLTVPLSTEEAPAPASLSGRTMQSCATLNAKDQYDRDDPPRGAHERRHDRSQARLSDLERTGVLGSAGRGPPEVSRRRGGGS